jgi:hypothetical protein
MYFPLRRNISSIIVNKPPFKLLNTTFKPFFEIYFGNSNILSYTNKSGFFDQTKIFANEADRICITDSDFNLPICGDLTIKLYNNKLMSTKKIGRIAFNTAFINEESNILIFKVREIDPDVLQITPGIPKEFEFIIKFTKDCECSNKFYDFNLCEKCAKFLDKEVIDWKEINKTIEVFLFLFNYFNRSFLMKKNIFMKM